jgi:hypothetical protein
MTSPEEPIKIEIGGKRTDEEYKKIDGANCAY